MSNVDLNSLGANWSVSSWLPGPNNITVWNSDHSTYKSSLGVRGSFFVPQVFIPHAKDPGSINFRKPSAVQHYCHCIATSSSIITNVVIGVCAACPTVHPSSVSASQARGAGW